VDRFVANAAQQLYRVYRYLWEEEGETAGYVSALELPLV
jgi:hypothetical protein